MIKMQKQLKLDSNSRGDWKSVRNVKWGLFTKRRSEKYNFIFKWRSLLLTAD